MVVFYVINFSHFYVAVFFSPKHMLFPYLTLLDVAADLESFSGHSRGIHDRWLIFLPLGRLVPMAVMSSWIPPSRLSKSPISSFEDPYLARKAAK